VGFEWLPATLAALRGIEAYEVAEALAADRRWPRMAIGPGSVEVMTVWARTEAGRRLIVVARRADAFDWWIVGARAMSGVEAAEYDRWEADHEQG
jgi:hypothetical protein